MSPRHRENISNTPTNVVGIYYSKFHLLKSRIYREITYKPISQITLGCVLKVPCINANFSFLFKRNLVGRSQRSRLEEKMLRLNVRIFHVPRYIGWFLFCTPAHGCCSITGNVPGKNASQGREKVREFYFVSGKIVFEKIPQEKLK